MSQIFVSCLDILLYKDVNGNLTTKLYDKSRDFSFSKSISLTYLGKKHHHLLIVFCLTAYLLCESILHYNNSLNMASY